MLGPDGCGRWTRGPWVRKMALYVASFVTITQTAEKNPSGKPSSDSRNMVSTWQPLTRPLLVLFQNSYKDSEKKMKIHTDAKKETDR